MRLSELLGTEVVDEGGNALGEVHDVRLREEVSEAGTSSTRRFVVDGVLVGVGAVGARLGYAHGEVAGPRLLALAMRRLARRARYVTWSALRFERHRLVAAAQAEDLVHPADHGSDEP